ncbi:MAG: tetratricopeptide repeat protein [Microscillaceae bacterium]|jgi:tetratricopeptide (TPR) repeat protein|nr:tetratricopeptide repeat protein [Microscillaceae bacterium]
MSSCVYKSDKSIAPYLRALTNVLPQHFDLFNHLAMIYKGTYDFQLAVEYFRQAEKIAPEKLDYLQLGECLNHLQQFAEAITCYAQAEAQNLENEQLYRLWGYACRETNDFENCIKAYRKADHLNPDQTWYLGNIGWCYQKIDQYKEGLNYHLRCENIAPYDAWNLDNIGYCYQRLKDYTRAVAYYQKSLSLNNYRTWTKTQLGWCMIVLGNFAQARVYFKEVLATKDADLSQYALMNTGHSYLATNEPIRAFSFYKKSVIKYENADNFAQEFSDDFEYVQQSGAVSAADYQLIKKELLNYREKYFRKSGSQNS